MPASKTKQVFAEKHKPSNPVISLERVTFEMVEGFIFHAGAIDAYAELDKRKENFTIEPRWTITCEEDGVIYLLHLTLLVLTARGAPIEVEIPKHSGIWNAIVTASEIREVVIKTPYPPQA